MGKVPRTEWRSVKVRNLVQTFRNDQDHWALWPETFWNTRLLPLSIVKVYITTKWEVELLHLQAGVKFAAVHVDQPNVLWRNVWWSSVWQSPDKAAPTVVHGIVSIMLWDQYVKWMESWRRRATSKTSPQINPWMVEDPEEYLRFLMGQNTSRSWWGCHDLRSDPGIVPSFNASKLIPAHEVNSSTARCWKQCVYRGLGLTAQFVHDLSSAHRC